MADGLEVTLKGGQKIEIVNRDQDDRIIGNAKFLPTDKDLDKVAETFKVDYQANEALVDLGSALKKSCTRCGAPGYG